MAQATESVDVKLPSGETVSALVPHGTSDEQVRTMLQAKHPEFFHSQGAAPQSSNPSVSGGDFGSQDVGAMQMGQRGSQALSRLAQGTNAVSDWLQKPLASIPQPKAMAGAEADAERGIVEGNPWKAAFNTFVSGSDRDARNIVSSLTSPTGIAATLATEGEGIPSKLALGGLGAFFGIKGAKDAATPRQPGENAPDAMQRRLLGASQVAGGAAGVGSGVNTALETRGAFNLLNPAKLLEDTHSKLNSVAESSKRNLRDVQTNVSQHVGKLANDIAASDFADKPAGGSISLTDLNPKVGEIANDYRVQTALPEFDKFSGRLESMGPSASWADLKELRTDLGAALNRARMPRDSGASGALYKAITDKLQSRAEELGRGKQFESYNQTYRTLKQYEQDGALHDLLNSNSGQDFYQTMKDPKRAAEIKGITKDLSQYGLDPKWREQFLDNHKNAYNYVSNANAGMGMRGRLKAIARHPVAGTVGAIGGGVLGSASGVPMGSWLGSTAGAVGSANMMDRMNAARELSRQGGVLKVTGAMGKRVEPIDPDAKVPSAPQSAVDKGDLVSALKSLGYTKDEANIAAIRAIKSGAKDFDSALRSAMQGRR